MEPKTQYDVMKESYAECLAAWEADQEEIQKEWEAKASASQASEDVIILTIELRRQGSIFYPPTN